MTIVCTTLSDDRSSNILFLVWQSKNRSKQEYSCFKQNSKVERELCSLKSGHEEKEGREKRKGLIKCSRHQRIRTKTSTKRKRHHKVSDPVKNQRSWAWWTIVIRKGEREFEVDGWSWTRWSFAEQSIVAVCGQWFELSPRSCHLICLIPSSG